MLRSSESVARTWGWCAMSDELKPCPFCGGEAMLFDAVGEMWACCKTCLASSRMHSDPIKAAAAWNARAAVTDEPFATAVHDGRVWQVVRECHDAGTSSNFFRCSSCGCEIMRCVDGWKPLYMGDVNYCPNCGAKVVAE